VNWIDIAIAALMLLGFLHGLIKGAIQEVFAVLALVVGVVIGGMVAEGTVSVTSNLSHPTAAKAFAFVITFLLVAIAVGLVGKMFSGLAKAANLRLMDRLLGGVVGACLVGLAVGLFFKVGEAFGMDTGFVYSSPLARQLVAAVSYLATFLPKGAESTAV
jgi:membrane protein required for colicin V production